MSRIESADPGIELRVSGIPACEPDRVPMAAAGLGWHGWTVADGDDLDAGRRLANPYFGGTAQGGLHAWPCEVLNGMDSNPALQPPSTMIV